MQMTEWQLFHAFRRLAGEGKVRPLSCANPNCGQELVTTRADDDSLVLYCAFCNEFIYPGLDLISRVRAVVLEHTEFG